MESTIGWKWFSFGRSSTGFCGRARNSRRWATVAMSWYGSNFRTWLSRHIWPTKQLTTKNINTIRKSQTILTSNDKKLSIPIFIHEKQSIWKRWHFISATKIEHWLLEIVNKINKNYNWRIALLKLRRQTWKNVRILVWPAFLLHRSGKTYCKTHVPLQKTGKKRDHMTNVAFYDFLKIRHWKEQECNWFENKIERTRPQHVWLTFDSFNSCPLQGWQPVPWADNIFIKCFICSYLK